MKTIAINKKASFNFNISEKIEVGLVLTGSEVRSLRLYSASIKESYNINFFSHQFLTQESVKIFLARFLGLNDNFSFVDTILA